MTGERSTVRRGAREVDGDESDTNVEESTEGERMVSLETSEGSLLRSLVKEESGRSITRNKNFTVNSDSEKTK